MTILVYNADQNTNEPLHRLKMPCIPRVGETLIFEEYDELEKEGVVKRVNYNFGEDDELLFVELDLHFL